MNITEFKKKNKPKKISNLKKFEAEILELSNANYSQVSILNFLLANGLRTTQQNLSKFIQSIDENKVQKINIKDKNKNSTSSLSIPKLQKVGKDLDIKKAPSWAN